MNIEQALRHMLKSEGGYVNHPSDPGGETNHGITIAVARANGYLGPMSSMPLSIAIDIYRACYWGRVRADELPSAIRFHVFDAAVNSGPKQAVKWLQRCAGVTDDGLIGAVTIAAAGKVTPALYSAERLRFMTTLNGWSAFGKGWARRICDNLEISE